MREIDALYLLWRMARKFHQSSVLHGLEKSPEAMASGDKTATAKQIQGKAMDVVWALIEQVRDAEAVPGGAVALAMQVLEQQGYEPIETVTPRPSWVRRFLDLSTGHLTLKTREQLQSNTLQCTVTYQADPYGWWVYVTQDDGILAEFPQDLADVILYARKHGCEWIKLDSDGPELEGLPWYSEAEDGGE
jgi:hypothetical protein